MERVILLFYDGEERQNRCRFVAFVVSSTLIGNARYPVKQTVTEGFSLDLTQHWFYKINYVVFLYIISNYVLNSLFDIIERSYMYVYAHVFLYNYVIYIHAVT